MINIYLSSKPNININTFFQKYNKTFKKNNINFESNLENADIVFYMFNLGVKKLFKDDNLSLNKKYDYNKEIKNILYYIKLNKKLIIYVRKDGSGIFNVINNLLKNHKKSILFIIKDFLLKNQENYKLLSDNHYKYLISKIYPKKDKEIFYVDYYNDLSKYFCYTIPYCKNIPYTFLHKKYIFNKKKNEKTIDIFYVKNYRENTYNCIYRKKLYDKLNLINKSNKYNLFNEKCSKEDFYNNLLKSKIMISVWGIGESLVDDYFCLMNDIIVLRVDTSHVKDFYGLYEKDNIFYFFNLDFSNLEERIDYILNNYEKCYKLYNKKREQIYNKFTPIYHVDVLSNKIKNSFNKK